MKKLLITGAALLALTSFAGAQQQGTSTEQLPPPLPPIMTTGSTTVDLKVRTLRQEYEAKIKALQQEYLAKLKILIGERRDMRASSTEARKDAREEKKDDRKDMRASSTASSTIGGAMRPPKGLEHTDGKVKGTSTEGVPQGGGWGLLRKFLGF
jgi:hypothetical protein